MEQRIVIVDDEKRIRNSIASLLKLHCPEVVVVGEAEDVSEAKGVILAQKPDVVLLDIKMPGGTGFDLLKSLIPVKFKVIFITAFDKFAIQAFKFSAVDYLMKPVIPQELVDALGRAKDVNDAVENTKLNLLVSESDKPNSDDRKIVLNTQEAMHILKIKEIVYCEADRNYTLFVIKDKPNILVSGGLKEYEDMLTPFGFFRPHNSYLVNLSLVEKLEKRDGGTLIMSGGLPVPVSTRKHAELVSAINKI